MEEKREECVNKGLVLWATLFVLYIILCVIFTCSSLGKIKLQDGVVSKVVDVGVIEIRMDDGAVLEATVDDLFYTTQEVSMFTDGENNYSFNKLELFFDNISSGSSSMYFIALITYGVAWLLGFVVYVMK